MALSDDQRALLRLLAQREEGYEDIAALMGLSVEEVRARVKGALAELDEAPSAAGPVVGQDSSSSQAAGEEPGPTPPAAEAPTPSRPSAEPTPRRPAPQAEPRQRSPLPKSRRRLLELVGGAIVVVLLVLFATGAIDIGGDDSDGNGSDGAANVATGGQLTAAVLEPVGDSDEQGRALFGRVGQNPVLQIQAQGLEPSPPGASYTVWLYRAPKLALRIGAIRVGKSGDLAAQLPIPLELLGFVANGAFKEIRVSLVDDAAYKTEVATAKRQNRLPGYAGETVLTGEIEGPALEAQ